ncbi:hypothetical protein [Streptomyces hygroscopicus]|uniref:hypothetical protein n=1 Tax=Streptomyces hygroscopicus TaxID=1912 RepID=UPI00157C3F0C|nr:hypothetical protein [Streptomyces hygroscopicus]
MDSHLSDGVQTALGREPRFFAQLVADATGAGAWRDGPDGRPVPAGGRPYENAPRS